MTQTLESSRQKLSQNMQHLLMEIGEKSVLYRLCLLTKDTDRDVYQNLSEAGCDLPLICRSDPSTKLLVEVKTRQRLFTTANWKNERIIQFTASDNEYVSCDFIMAYWFDRNAYFIVPKGDLRATSANGVRKWKFIVRARADGSFDSRSERFLNAWDLILNRMT